MTTAGFTVSGITFPEGEDPLGLWRAPTAESVAFSAQAAGDATGTLTWEIALPETPEAAAMQLAAQQRALDEAHTLLDQTEAELQRLAAPDAPRSYAVSTPETMAFDVAEPTVQMALQAHERQLLDTVYALQTPVSYGIDLKRKEEDQAAKRAWFGFVEQVKRMVAYYANIKTTLGSVPIGLTRVTWLGDFDTTWEPGCSAFALARHRQAVNLTLASRLALLRVVGVVATGAAGLAIKAHLPGQQVLLLPATYRFVRNVLKVLREWKATQT